MSSFDCISKGCLALFITSIWQIKDQTSLLENLVKNVSSSYRSVIPSLVFSPATLLLILTKEERERGRKREMKLKLKKMFVMSDHKTKWTERRVMNGCQRRRKVLLSFEEMLCWMIARHRQCVWSSQEFHPPFHFCGCLSTSSSSFVASVCIIFIFLWGSKTFFILLYLFTQWWLMREETPFSVHDESSRWVE